MTPGDASWTMIVCPKDRACPTTPALYHCLPALAVAGPHPAPGIVNAELLGWLPKGAAVINGGRGRHLLEADLLAALDSGQAKAFFGLRQTTATARGCC